MEDSRKDKNMKISEDIKRLNSMIEGLDSWFKAHPNPYELSEEDVNKIYSDLTAIRFYSEDLSDRI